jgi:hypothetical protein
MRVVSRELESFDLDAATARSMTQGGECAGRGRVSARDAQDPHASRVSLDAATARGMTQGGGCAGRGRVSAWELFFDTIVRLENRCADWRAVDIINALVPNAQKMQRSHA